MMHTRGLGVTAAIVLGSALCCMLALAACSLLERTYTRPQPPDRTATSAADQRITQLDFGLKARFSRCVEPTCPAVTRKTLAVAAIPAAQPMATELLATPAAEPTPSGKREPSIAAEPTRPPHKLVLHFSTDSAALTATHKSLLRGAITELRKTDRIVIVGRTDNLGSEARNQSLAFGRAIAIRDHLLDLAPDLPARIAIDAKGLCCYAAPNETADGRAQNRRVDLVFTLPAEAKP